MLGWHRGVSLAKHLVTQQSGPVRDVLARVEDAHTELVRAARAVVEQLRLLPDDAWGVRAKRIVVVIGETAQPLGEVINQCATIERLLDALRWIDEQFPGAAILECHPTTSDGTNDLVAQTTMGGVLRFEVSDVIDPRDSNGKEDKDICSLREAMTEAPGVQRSFLVVSEALGKQILEREKRGRAKKLGRPKSYTKIHSSKSETFIIEIRFSADPEARV